MGRLLISLIYATFALFLLGLLGFGWGYAEFTRPGPLKVSRVVVIPQGLRLDRIAKTLENVGVIQYPVLFIMAAKITGQSRDLKAGEYRFPADVSPRTVVSILIQGKTVARRLTFIEGLSVTQIVEKINKSDGLLGDIEILPDEGSLLPETYYFSFGDRRKDLVMRMAKEMQLFLSKTWQKRSLNLHYSTPKEALIIASMIEKETGIKGERALISGVFVNRLRKRMRLQSDPTVAYGLRHQKLGRELTKQDLSQYTPYNTYLISGLPPTPICNPGKASIVAALNPRPSKFFYFVANGSGGHAFATTLEEHNQNVARWRRLKNSIAN